MSYLTVAALRQALADKRDDAWVVLAKDAEGNGFSPLAAVEPCIYTPESSWSGHAIPDDGPEPGNAVVIWPRN